MIEKRPIAIIGAGSSGLAMAAHLSHYGHDVKLWNRSKSNIENIIMSGRIKSKGAISGKTKINSSVSIKEALDGVELVMVTTPANSHKEIAERIAKYVTPNMLVVLNPGRTCGAIEFSKVLEEKGCNANPQIAETQTIIYTCRKMKSDLVNIIAFKKQVFLCGLNSYYNESIIQKLPRCLQGHFIPAKTMVETSFGNVGMILHCAPMLLNIGWIESPKTEFKYYYDGITPSIASFLEQLDKERIEVSKKLGNAVESTAAWLRRTYSIKGRNLYECIQNNLAYKTIDAPSSMRHRYILEDIPCGLVPLEAVGRFFGLSMKNTTMIIDLACQVMNIDFRKNGRNLQSLGLEGKSKKGIIRVFNGSN
jgi:opine dehydrogenase